MPLAYPRAPKRSEERDALTERQSLRPLGQPVSYRCSPCNRCSNSMSSSEPLRETNAAALCKNTETQPDSWHQSAHPICCSFPWVDRRCRGSLSPDEVLPGRDRGHPVVPALVLFGDAAVHPRHSDDIALQHGGPVPPTAHHSPPIAEVHEHIGVCFPLLHSRPGRASSGCSFKR